MGIYFNKKEALATSNAATVDEQKPIKEEPNEESKIKDSDENKETDQKSEDKPIEQPNVEEPVVESEPVKEESKPTEPKAEKKSTNKPKQTPQRVNGKFVSKKEAPAKASKNSSRWTKENNPTANKRRAQGGQK